MPECARCHQPVGAQAIACPHCRAPLKAHGHPGITLYRATGGEHLCKTCIYDADDTCTYPQRPYAQECTLYTTAEQRVAGTTTYALGRMRQLSSWVQANSALLVIGAIILVSLAIALNR